MGFSHHRKNLDHWMVIEIFRLLATKFKKKVCNMFLENSHQALHKAIEGDPKFSCQ
jgi:hypothetical protein